MPDPHDVAGRELQRHGVVARQLHRERGAVGELELGADLEAQVDDAVDHRLEGAVARLGGHAQVVGAHEVVADPGDGAEEAHDEAVGRALVELARGALLLDAARR